MFDSPEEAQRACQKDRETFGEKFGDRYVRVYPTLESDVADMQQAVQQQNMVQQVGSDQQDGTACNVRAALHDRRIPSWARSELLHLECSSSARHHITHLHIPCVFQRLMCVDLSAGTFTHAHG